MEKVFEVCVDHGSRIDQVTGSRMYVEESFLHIEDDKGCNVAIYAQFDSVIVKPQAKTE